MIRIIYAILLFGALFTTTACGRKPVLDVPQEFSSYVSQFEATAAQSGHPVQVTDLVVRFGNMETALEEGACEISDSTTPTITIRKDNWDAMSESQRQQLMFHEMGHCVLYKHHNAQLSTQGVPVSIMNPYIIRADLYVQNHDHYMNELFN